MYSDVGYAGSSLRYFRRHIGFQMVSRYGVDLGSFWGLFGVLGYASFVSGIFGIFQKCRLPNDCRSVLPKPNSALFCGKWVILKGLV